MRKIAIYGKGGIGKSTTTANLAAALSEINLKVLQVGCDPKHDSTRTIAGKFIPTVLDTWRESEKSKVPITRDKIVFRGYNNIACIEAGGPEPGVGCAGRGILRMMDILEDLDIFDEDFDVVLYDVLGDVVCGGFAKPIQAGYSKEIYVVTSGEFMALYAANNIAVAIERVGKSRGVKLGGIICNSRELKQESQLVSEFATAVNSHMIHIIGRNSLIQKYERHARTVIEGDPHAEISGEYRKLAEKIINNNNMTVPTPLSFNGLMELCQQYDAEDDSND